MGDSAGGNLAVTTLLRACREGVPRPAGLVLMSPWVDLTEASLSAPSMVENERSDFIPRKLMRLFKEAYCDGASANGIDPADPLISPLYAEPAELAAALPRTLVTFGTGEELLDQQRAFCRHLREAGVPMDVYEQQAMPHVAPVFASLAYGHSQPRCELGSGSGPLAAGGSMAACLLQGADLEAQEEAPPPVEANNRIERFVASVWQAPGMVQPITVTRRCTSGTSTRPAVPPTVGRDLI